MESTSPHVYHSLSFTQAQATSTVDIPPIESSLTQFHEKATSTVDLPPIESNLTKFHEKRLHARILRHFLLFLLLEISFFILGIISHAHPIVISSLPSKIGVGQLKAGFTVLMIIWQTLAIMSAQNIVFHGFSGEWFNIFNSQHTRNLEPGETDKVSTLTSSFVSKLAHLFTPKSSSLYRASFIGSLILIALASLAPGTISVDDGVEVWVGSKLNITKFVVGGDGWPRDTDDEKVLGPVVRAGFVMDLEQRMRSPFSYNVEEGYIVGWPQGSFDQDDDERNGDVTYETNVLKYNIKCRWEHPELKQTKWRSTWTTADGSNWYPWDTPLDGLTFPGGMMPMYRFDPLQPHPEPDDYPDPTSAQFTPLGVQGYLFFGGNGSTSTKKNSVKVIDLDGLPTTHSSSGFKFTDVSGDSGLFNTSLATFLICDPNLQILNGNVFLSKSNRSITVDSDTLIDSDSNITTHSSVGNITPEVANFMFSMGMLDGLEVDDDLKEDVRIGMRAKGVFLQEDMKVKKIEEIEGNLMRYMNSAGKAFASYTHNYDHQTLSSIELAGQGRSEGTFLTEVNSNVKQSKPAIVASGTLLAVNAALFIIVVGLLSWNCFRTGEGKRVWDVPGFKLVNLVTYGGLKLGYTSSSNSKTYELDEKSKSIDNLSMKIRLRQTDQKNLLWLFLFVILQISFAVLLFICASRPLLIPSLTLFDNLEIEKELKGVFTAVFILWHTVSVWLVSDLVSLGFSCEWSFHLLRANHELDIPQLNYGVRVGGEVEEIGEEEKVSLVTANLVDRFLYFLHILRRKANSRPSSTYIISFLLSLFLVGINALGPGAINVSRLHWPQYTNISVADLRSLNSEMTSSGQRFLIDKAFTIGMMEVHEDMKFRYDMQDGWLIPWPVFTGGDGNIEYEYDTDMISFQHECTWMSGKSETHNKNTTWRLDGRNWSVWEERRPLDGVEYDVGILPLFGGTEDAHTAYLFVGTDSANSDDEEGEDNGDDDEDEDDFGVTLDDLPPVMRSPKGLVINNSTWEGPLSTILLCDPHMNIISGRAKLSNNRIEVLEGGRKVIGNAPEEAVNVIFSYGLVNTLSVRDLTSDDWVEILSVRTFLGKDKKPLGIKEIEGNLNKMMSMTAKAFIDGMGNVVDDDDEFRSMSLIVDGKEKVESLVLEGTRWLGIVLVVLDLGAALLFMRLLDIVPSSPHKLQYLKQIKMYHHV